MQSVPREPPERYRHLPNSTALTVNEYDRNLFAECSYVGSRTLIKCQQIRRRDLLSRNGGWCEMHTNFQHYLKRKAVKEMHRMELDSPTKKKRIRKILRPKGYALVEDCYLRAISDISAEGGVKCGSRAIRPHPLESSNILTVEDLRKIKLYYREHELRNLKISREIIQTCDVEDVSKKLAAHETGTNSNTIQCKKCHEDSPWNFTENHTLVHSDTRQCMFWFSQTTLTNISTESDVKSVLGGMVQAVCLSQTYENVSGRCVGPAAPHSPFCVLHSNETYCFPRCRLTYCDNIVVADLGDGRSTGYCALHSLKAPLRPTPPEIQTTVLESGTAATVTHIVRSIQSEYAKEKSNIQKDLDSDTKISGISPAVFTENRTSRAKDTQSCTAARCRPFTREFFPEKPKGRIQAPPLPIPGMPTMGTMRNVPTIPRKVPQKQVIVGTRPYAQPGAPAPPPSGIFATGPRTMTAFRPQVRPSMPTKQREEDRLAVASILDAATSSGNAPGTSQQTMAPVRRPAVMYSGRLPGMPVERSLVSSDGSVDLSNLPLELRDKPVHQVLRMANLGEGPNIRKVVVAPTIVQPRHGMMMASNRPQAVPQRRVTAPHRIVNPVSTGLPAPPRPPNVPPRIIRAPNAPRRNPVPPPPPLPPSRNPSAMNKPVREGNLPLVLPPPPPPPVLPQAPTSSVNLQTKDPLSILADVSASMRDDNDDGELSDEM